MEKSQLYGNMEKNGKKSCEKLVNMGCTSTLKPAWKLMLPIEIAGVFGAASFFVSDYLLTQVLHLYLPHSWLNDQLHGCVWK